jgi:hypothetical protein
MFVVSISDVQNIQNPQDSVKAGLVSDNSAVSVDLVSVHVRARLVDLAAEVIVWNIISLLYM